MATPPPPTSEEPRNVEQDEEKDNLYKTKIVQFLGRTTPIILQNDNGPCPLLAICNVLLLRNNLNLSVDTAEVSPQKLLSLVAERLIDSNSNIEDKDAGYVENQQQNIADAIDLLPRLATGIDVNVQFRRIDDFEFTRECTIFDLLDIPLYHGWIVDPQDTETANAIGLKSYNTLMGELVALETRNTDGVHKSESQEDCIDFAAATTATLGVPSPCLSRGMSFDESPRSVPDHHIARKGDLEEEAELVKVLMMSNTAPTLVENSCSVGTNGNNLPVSSDEGSHFTCSGTSVLPDESAVNSKPKESIDQSELTSPHDSVAPNSSQDGKMSSPAILSLSESSAGIHLSNSKECEKHIVSSEMKEQTKEGVSVPDQVEPPTFPEGGTSSNLYEEHTHGPGADEDQHIHQPSMHDTSTSSDHLAPDDKNNGSETTGFVGTPSTHTNLDLTSDTIQPIDIPKGDTSSLASSEPIYEGEDRILDAGVASYENREPMYEGEIILAEQAERGSESICDEQPQDITQHHGELISNFLRNNASQLTIYGLFCLQDGLKERELCVFFRNNHFSTLFKFNGELYLLATDQGYINQPDLVWEKLNEVNGDTVFMTGNFKEFKVDNHVNDTWDQRNAMANTADYLSSIDNSVSESSEMNSDLQLAIALQQQEFENQPQRQQSTQQSISSGNSRLVVGPQTPTPRSNASSSSSKQESKSKEKCTLM